MSDRTIRIEHNGQTYYGQVATIESTSLGVEDHNILTAHLHFKGKGWGIGVGGYGLDEPVFDDDGSFVCRRPTAYGFDHIIQMARTVGARRWEDLPGMVAIVLFESENSLGLMSAGVAHISDPDKVFLPREHAREWGLQDGDES